MEYEKKFENNNVKIVNLDDEFEIVSNIPKVNIILKGPMPELETYEPDNGFVQIDCSSVKNEGIYSLPVKINYPKNFKMISKSFDKINLKVSKNEIEQKDNSDENQTNNEEQIFEPVNEDLKNENKDKEHKDLMLSKVEGAVKSMIQNESSNNLTVNDER